MRLQRLFLVTVLLAIFATPFSSLHSQTPPVVLSLAVPPGLEKLFGTALFQDFETANPGVSVQVVQASPLSQPTNGLQPYLTAVQQYASSADVLFVSPELLSPIATRAGFLLDLAPLIAADSSLSSDAFYPAAWRSFQWDQGFWALPVWSDAYMLTYDLAAFDKAGLAYPDDYWTLADLEKAVRQLSSKDSNGSVTVQGLAIANAFAEQTLYLSLIQRPLFNADVVPEQPTLDQPVVENVLTTWSGLQRDGLVGNRPAVSPMAITSVQSLRGTDGAGRSAVLLPGGKAGLITQGFAISAGTQYPAQAYALVKQGFCKVRWAFLR